MCTGVQASSEVREDVSSAGAGAGGVGDLLHDTGAGN